jgi:hypothetical protein
MKCRMAQNRTTNRSVEIRGITRIVRPSLKVAIGRIRHFTHRERLLARERERRRASDTAAKQTQSAQPQSTQRWRPATCTPVTVKVTVPEVERAAVGALSGRRNVTRR